MTGARTPSIRQTRIRANRLLERILADLADEGLLEPAVAADGSEGYRITDAGLDYLARHGIDTREAPARRKPLRFGADRRASPTARSTTRSRRMCS